MERHRIGIFGALMALGGFLAVRYVQRNRAAQVPVRELSQWEGEGGTVATPAPPSGSVTAASTGPSTLDTAHAENASIHSNGKDGPWPFPRS